MDRISRNIKNISIGLVVLMIILVISSIGWVISSYNKMVSLDQSVKKSYSNIETNLQRRYDLIPNLVETAKGYANQEKEIFTNIANARAKLGEAETIKDKANADSELSSALSRLLVVVENYPELKSNENFKALMVDLEGTENRINIARRDYNDAVDEYNRTIKTFPNSIIASMFKFEEKEYYEASSEAKEAPKVDFSTGE